MKVQNMTSPRGNQVANQFVISGILIHVDNNPNPSRGQMFQSYNSNIAFISTSDHHAITYLDEYYWNYSRTTSKYRNQFLGETTKETQVKIDSGEYKLVNLN